MEEFRDEDQITKLWDQFATNKLRFAKMTIVEVIGNIKGKKTIFVQLFL